MKVAVVVGVAVEHDAISSAAVTQVAALRSLPDVDEVHMFTQWLEREPGCPSHVIGSPWDLLRNRDFRRCDVAVFHWGIYYALFDSITLMTSPALPTPVVHFHNCTPPSLVEGNDRDHLLRSIQQLHHVIHMGVALWTYSEFNRRTLIDWGAGNEQIDRVTFPLSAPNPPDAPRASDSVELLTVGRMVPAKGLHVLLEALEVLPDQLLERIRLRIVGSTRFSSDAYQVALYDKVRLGRPLLGKAVEFVIAPSDADLAEAYREAHIVISPSFHEGLCVPVVEGYAAGCRAIGTTAGNLPYIVFTPDPVVPPGDAPALAQAIESVVTNPVVTDPTYHARRRELVESFSPRSASEMLHRALIDVVQNRTP